MTITGSNSEGLNFSPSALTRNCHLQTLMAMLGTMRAGDVPSVPIQVRLEDGDALCCEESKTADWQPHYPTTILVHGLGGSHSSQYMVRMAHMLLQSSHRVIRVNMRGCGSGIALCRRPYHGGLSNDIGHVLHHFHATAPHSPTSIVGYSLGGNVVLKYAGEQGDALKRYIHAIVAVSPPFYLERCLQKLNESPLSFYERYLMAQMRRQYMRWAAHNPSLKIVPLAPRLRISEFDDQYTAPLWNFKDRHDYYRCSSCGPWIERIGVPCHIISANDDPVVDSETVLSLKLPSCVRVSLSSHGGHMGFVTSFWDRSGIRWLDQAILRSIA